jgi:hypothetical protein
LNDDDDDDDIEVVSYITFTGPNANPNGFDVTLSVKEKRLATSSVGTQVGNNEGSMVRNTSNTNEDSR